MPVTLDPQDARPLTSREISKLLCGVIGSLVHYDERDIRRHLPRVLELVSMSSPPDFERLDELVGAYDGTIKHPPATWAAALSATVISLRTWCKTHDVQTALVWISQNLETICRAPWDASASARN